jgi:hypothetical protein
VLLVAMALGELESREVRPGVLLLLRNCRRLDLCQSRSAVLDISSSRVSAEGVWLRYFGEWHAGKQDLNGP